MIEDVALPERQLRELALFAGAGGGILGGHLLGMGGKMNVSSCGIAFGNAYICTMGKPKKDYIYGPILTCKQCGTPFQPRDKASKAKYCSYACNNASRRIYHERPCAICSKPFTPTRNGWVTCSRQCGTKYRLSRRVTDPMAQVRKRMAVHCCSVIHRCLRAKTDRTYTMLGYRVNDLIKHLEQKFVDGMGWHNYGKGAGCWSIDHIRPISSFPPTATIAEINALSNLQPLWHSENCRKQNKWDAQ